MDSVTLNIEYSPILRELINIKRNGKDVQRDIGSWQKVFNNLKTADGKCNFLQEVGISFFDALYEACYETQGETLIIDMQTTEEVFKDFEKMANWYSNHNCNNNKIVVRELTKKLTSNDTISNNIEEIASNLDKSLIKQKKQLNTLNNKNVLTVLDRGISELEKSLRLTSDDNIISVCVTGVYSSGKSTFINAILGDDILESKDDPSTAAIFSIKKIEKNEKIAIEFFVISPEYEDITLFWENNKFKPAKPISNQIINKELIEKLTEEKNISEQFKIVSAYINDKIKSFKNQDNIQDCELQIEPNVTIFYPFELGGKIPVKICDTPGTNSSYKDDGEIIQKALANQKNSILITLLNPIKSDDRAGNNILFNTINDAEQQNSYLDKSRLFFIWNFIDGSFSKIDSIQAKKDKIIEIEEEDNSQNIKNINLAEYPLFFMSSKRALCAQKLIQDPSDNNWLDDYSDCNVRTNLSKECSLGWQTESVHKKAEKALQLAGDDEYKQALIISGLYSVKNGITDYINKYASAIIANGRYRVIGDIVEDLNSALAYEKDIQEEAKKNAFELFEKTEKELKQFIEDTYNSLLKQEIDNDNSKKELEELNKKISDKIENLSENLKGFHMKKTNENNIRINNEKLNDFVDEIIKKQNEKVEKTIDEIFNSITQRLQGRFEETLPANVWDKIKKDVYRKIKEKDSFKIPGIEEKSFLWLHKLDKNSFKTQATLRVNQETSSVRNSIMDFNETKKTALFSIKESYLENLEDYSQTLLRYKNNAKGEEENLKLLEKLCSEVTKHKNEIENLIFN